MMFLLSATICVVLELDRVECRTEVSRPTKVAKECRDLIEPMEVYLKEQTESMGKKVTYLFVGCAFGVLS